MVLEEELSPRRPPVVGAGDDRSRVEELDPGAVADLRGRLRPLVLDLDLARLTGVVRSDGRQIRERLLRTCLNELTRPRRRDHPRARDTSPLLDLDGGQPLAEQLFSFGTGSLITGHEQHRAAPGPAERRIDPGLADERSVEP